MQHEGLQLQEVNMMLPPQCKRTNGDNGTVSSSQIACKETRLTTSMQHCWTTEAAFTGLSRRHGYPGSPKSAHGHPAAQEPTPCRSFVPQLGSLLSYLAFQASASILQYCSCSCTLWSSWVISVKAVATPACVGRQHGKFSSVIDNTSGI